MSEEEFWLRFRSLSNSDQALVRLVVARLLERQRGIKR